MQTCRGGDLRQERAEPAPLMQKNFPPYSEDEWQPASVTLTSCGPARRRKPPPMPRRGFCSGKTPPYPFQAMPVGVERAGVMHGCVASMGMSHDQGISR